MTDVSGNVPDARTGRAAAWSASASSLVLDGFLHAVLDLAVLLVG